MKLLAALSLLIAVTCQAQTVTGVIVSKQPKASIAVVETIIVKEGDRIGSYSIDRITHDGVLINGRLVQVAVGKPQIQPITSMQESAQTQALADVMDGPPGNERFEAMIAKRIAKRKAE